MESLVKKLRPVVLAKALLVIAAIGISLYLYTALLRTDEPSSDELKEYLRSNSLQVGATTNGDYQQVYYDFGTKRHFITETAANRTGVKASGQYLVWLETPAQQNVSLVVLYDLLTKTKTQLTFTGNAQRPAIDGRHVAWEDRSGTTSEIMYFDGSLVQKITDGKYPSIRPAVKGTKVAYAQELGADTWRVVLRDVTSASSEIIYEGGGDKAWPRFEGDSLVTTYPNY